MKRLPAACPLGEAEVVEVRRVERFEIDVEQHERLDEDIKEDHVEVDAVGTDQLFVAKDNIKDILA